MVRDPLGCVRAVGGIYLDVVEGPITTVNDLRSYAMPDVSDTTDIRELRKAYPDVSILAEVSGVQQILCDILWDPGQYMLALYDYPDEIHRFNARLADWVVDQARAAVEAGADVVFIGDDYGTTGRTRISTDMWLEFTYPYLRRIIDAVHEMGALAMLHSCGYQMPLLEHYVAAGLDILQSFQPKAGNDFGAAYAQFGDRLAFATGIDTQRGESLTPKELRQEILHNHHIGRSKGRHIISMTHMMQYTMPMDNVRVIFDTVGEIRAGLHG